jgi:hypothetical protein
MNNLIIRFANQADQFRADVCELTGRAPDPFPQGLKDPTVEQLTEYHRRRKETLARVKLLRRAFQEAAADLYAIDQVWDVATDPLRNLPLPTTREGWAEGWSDLDTILLQRAITNFAEEFDND